MISKNEKIYDKMKNNYLKYIILKIYNYIFLIKWINNKLFTNKIFINKMLKDISKIIIKIL